MFLCLAWFDVDEKDNTKVYVSNLPLDMTEQEFVDLMQKCGLVMKEMDAKKFKIKMYTDPSTKAFKGDALCTYIKVLKICPVNLIGFRDFVLGSYTALWIGLCFSLLLNYSTIPAWH